MFGRLRWLTVLLPVLLVGAIELVSDSVLDEVFPLPLDALLVVVVVGILACAFSTIAFRRIDTLAGALASKNAELEARNASARALHRVSVAITALAGLDEILRAVVDQARSLLGADVAILLLNEPDGSVACRAANGPAEAIHPAGNLAGEDIARFVEPSYAVARLAAPLQRGGTTIGLLAVSAAAERNFGVDDVETLASLASQAAVALENARLQGRLRELAVVAERERIGREMHDGLAQVLGYVNTKSQAVEHLLAAGRVEEAQAQLDELADAARSVYVDVREAILGLRSPIAADGLVAALEAYVGPYATASKLAVSLDVSPEARRVELSPEVEIQAFRVLQEALTNVRKHSGAGRVDVRAAVRDGALVLSVTDDGRGLETPPASPGDWPHYGLVAMRERAEAAGATLALLGPPGGGTEVRLALPLRPGAGVPASGAA